MGCVRCNDNGELLGEGFSGRVSQGGGEGGCGGSGSGSGGSSGSGGGDGVCDGDDGDCKSGCGDKLSGLVRARVDKGRGSIEPRRSPSPPGSTPCSCSCPSPSPCSGEEPSGSSSSGSASGGPMTSVTMRARFTLWEGCVSGSIRADGGGQTLSWNMEPDSEARARSRRGGVRGEEDGGGSKGAGKGVCGRDDESDCERENRG